MPIYPVFSSFVNDVTESDFSRQYIDESSILSSYFGTGNTLSDGEVFIQSKDSYLYVNAPIEDERDVTGSSEILEYTVKSGESFAFIAQKFKISKDTIYWANNFASNKTLHPGDIIKIPPVSGLIHTVKSGDTLSAIAEKYDIEEDKIMRQNLLLSAADLRADTTLVIPGAKKEIPQPVLAAAPSRPTATGNSRS
jgi:LysM repeat protein